MPGEIDLGRGDDFAPDEDEVRLHLGDVGVEETHNVGQDANRDAVRDGPGTQVEELGEELQRPDTIGLGEENLPGKKSINRGLGG